MSPARSVGVVEVVARVADVLVQLVANVADMVGQALVAVGLAPGFLGLLLAFAIGLLHVVHVCDLLMSVASWSDCVKTVGRVM